MSRTHPLKNNPEWRFIQFSVGLQAPFRVRSGATQRKMVVRADSSCREGLVGSIRSGLTTKIRGQGIEPGTKEVEGCIVLDDDSLRQPGDTFLSVSSAHITHYRAREHPKAGQRMPRPCYWSGRWRARYPKYSYVNRKTLTPAQIQEFIDLCDALIGPLTVLLNPSRFCGNWWQTSVTESRIGGSLRWYGVDNSILAHPALVSLYTGLARQCALMARCGLREEILGQVDSAELRDCLENSDPKLALKLARKLQKWIAPPVYQGGHVENLPVPAGSFSKIPALHKAIYKHGFDTTFGKSLEAAWALTARDPDWDYGSSHIARYRGIHSFMGTQGNNENGARIRELAKQSPGKKQESE